MMIIVGTIIFRHGADMLIMMEILSAVDKE